MDDCREMVWDLVQSGVPMDSVDDVIHVVCAAFGITVTDNMSPRMVGQIILEGRIAAKMQLVHEIMNTECKSIQELNYFTSLTRNVISAITLSGNGTTHKHVTHESKHITLQTVDGTTLAT